MSKRKTKLVNELSSICKEIDWTSHHPSLLVRFTETIKAINKLTTYKPRPRQMVMEVKVHCDHFRLTFNKVTYFRYVRNKRDVSERLKYAKVGEILEMTFPTDGDATGALSWVKSRLHNLTPGKRHYSKLGNTIWIYIPNGTVTAKPELHEL